MVRLLLRGQLLFWASLLLLMASTTNGVAQVDTDGDGLLDLIDVPGFRPGKAGVASFSRRGIQDLDGTNLLRNLLVLNLDNNRITSIEGGDFDGMVNLLSLTLGSNQITNIESGAFDGLAGLGELLLSDNRITTIESRDFAGLIHLQTLRLDSNQITSIESGAFGGLASLRTLALIENAFSELNFTGAMFQNLATCDHVFGFCVDTEEIRSLVLDDATLSVSSFEVIVGELSLGALSDVSLVALTFSHANPPDLNAVLGIESLDNVWVDQQLLDLYPDEFNAFDAMDGNTVTVVLEGDCNKDGLFTASDLACVQTISSRDVVLAALNTLPGDLDGNGNVAFEDFLVLSANFGSDANQYADGNIDLQDGVGFPDFLVVSNNFGKTRADVAAVPEPNVCLLLGLGLLCIVSIRQRQRQ